MLNKQNKYKPDNKINRKPKWNSSHSFSSLLFFLFFFLLVSFSFFSFFLLLFLVGWSLGDHSFTSFLVSFLYFIYPLISFFFFFFWADSLRPLLCQTPFLFQNRRWEPRAPKQTLLEAPARWNFDGWGTRSSPVANCGDLSDYLHDYGDSGGNESGDSTDLEVKQWFRSFFFRSNWLRSSGMGGHGVAVKRSNRWSWSCATAAFGLHQAAGRAFGRYY